MKYTETEIEGVWLIEPRVFEEIGRASCRERV